MHGRRSLIYNVMTAVVLVATIAIVAVFVIVFVRPHNAFNPFPPPTVPAIAVLPTLSDLPTPQVRMATVTVDPRILELVETISAPTAVPPSHTATPTITRTPTLTATQTITRVASLTPTITPTLTATEKPEDQFPFRVQQGTPLALANFANPQGCQWLGVAGQVFNAAADPLSGYILRLVRAAETREAVSGTAPEYGPGGYEFVLDDHVVETRAEYTLQLYNSGRTPVSARLSFDTYADCNRNLILINFEERG